MEMYGHAVLGAFSDVLLVGLVVGDLLLTIGLLVRARRHFRERLRARRFAMH